MEKRKMARSPRLDLKSVGRLELGIVKKSSQSFMARLSQLTVVDLLV
jgi:hypothetical protein